ncbi:MAG: hypothetical protein ACK449_18085 [Planctomycetota bacterium]|jgi:hypothetical protein
MTQDFESSSSSISTRTIGWWMITLAFAVQAARILGVTAVNNEVPFLSANDRSRWSAIAALTQEGRWEIDSIVEILDSKGKSKLWNTIDMVRHQGTDGIEHSYSSKPPLLTFMLAAITKPVMILTHAWRGKTLTEDPFLVCRIVLILVNLIPLALWWCGLHRWLESHVPRPWTRMVILSLAIWGTFLTTFVVTLNNHLHGAIFFSMSLVFAWQILQASQSLSVAPWNVWLSLGITAALCVACELPALAWAAGIGAIVFCADPKRMLIGFGLGSACIAAAFLLANYWAHGDWRPPYSHRGLGEKIGQVDLDLTALQAAIDRKDEAKKIKEIPEQNQWIEQIQQQIGNANASITQRARVIPARLTGVYQVFDESTSHRVALAMQKPPKSVQDPKGTWNIYTWDDWYDYPKSYWLPGTKKGVDLGEPDRWNYLLQFTIGHHGILSLTPIWIWSLVGGLIWLAQGPSALPPPLQPHDETSSRYRSDSIDSNQLTGARRWILSEHGIAATMIGVTVACVVFYASRDVEDRNYGGVCSGFRWLFWMIPGWIWLAIPAIDRSATRPFWRGLVYLAIALGVLAAVIPWANPWSQPWPYRWLMWLSPDKYQ